MDPIAHAISLIRGKREEAVAEVQRLDEALAALEALAPTGRTTPLPQRASRTTQPGAKTKPPSVRAKALQLLEEGPADWSVGDILVAYEQRGEPVHGKNPKNALRAAIADAHTQGLVDRISPGRYRSANFRDNTDGSAGSTQEVVMP